MANELSVTTYISGAGGTNAYATVTGGSTTAFNVDQSTKRYTKKVVNVGTSEETIDLDDVSSPGYAYFKNLDGTNFVQLGASTGVYFARINADKGAIIPLDSGVTIYAKADTAAVDLDVLVFST